MSIAFSCSVAFIRPISASPTNRRATRRRWPSHRPQFAGQRQGDQRPQRLGRTEALQDFIPCKPSTRPTNRPETTMISSDRTPEEDFRNGQRRGGGRTPEKQDGQTGSATQTGARLRSTVACPSRRIRVDPDSATGPQEFPPQRRRRIIEITGPSASAWTNWCTKGSLEARFRRRPLGDDATMRKRCNRR